jgi:hypothetical protein
LTALIKLFVLADTLIDSKTANLVIDRIFAYGIETKNIPTHEQVNLGYTSTASGNPLRALLRDFIVYNGREDYIASAKDSSALHADFCYHIAAEYLKIKHSNLEYTTIVTAFTWHRNILSIWDKCLYHQHNGSKCEPSSTLNHDSDSPNSP